MKKTLEKSEDKIQEICDVLRRKTLEPAQEEAQKIIAAAQQRAEQIILDAEKHVEHLIKEARNSIEQERNVFHSSLTQAGKQSIETLRHSIEETLFNQQLSQAIVKHTSDPQVIAKLLSAIIEAIQKEGLKADLTAIIPKAVPAKEIAQYILSEVLKKLKEEDISLGDFSGGAKVRLDDKKIVIDISDKEILDLVYGYVRKDFRKMVFETEKKE